MKKKQIQAKSYFFTQYLDPKFWHAEKQFSKEEFENLFSNLSDVAGRFLKAFENNGQKVTRLALIVHDKDTYEDGSLKDKHVHIFLEFSKRVDANVVAKVLGLASQYVVPVKRGRYGRENSLAYMIHAKQPDKYQYDKTEVYCDNCQTDINTYPVLYKDGWYQQYVAEHEKVWKAYTATAERKERDLTLDLLIKQILHGKFREPDQLTLDDDAYALYADHPTEIGNAFAVYNRRKALLFTKALLAGKVTKKVIFVTGLPDAGKTHFATDLISAIQAVHPDWRFYMGGGDHPWDGYSGQEIAVLDDVRVNRLDADDWVHIMDPHYNNADLNSRYHNKKPAFHVLIITNYQDPITFFSYLRNNENLSQFLRRITYAVTILDAQSITKSDVLLTDNTAIATESSFESKEFASKLAPILSPNSTNYVISNYQKLGISTSYRVGNYIQTVDWTPVPFFAKDNRLSTINQLVNLLTGKVTKDELLSQYPPFQNLVQDDKIKLLPQPKKDTTSGKSSIS